MSFVFGKCIIKKIGVYNITLELPYTITCNIINMYSKAAKQVSVSINKILATSKNGKYI